MIAEFAVLLAFSLLKHMPYVVVAVVLASLCAAFQEARRTGNGFLSVARHRLVRALTSFWQCYRAAGLMVAAVIGHAVGYWGLAITTTVIYVCLGWVWMAARNPRTSPQSAS